MTVDLFHSSFNIIRSVFLTLRCVHARRFPALFPCPPDRRTFTLVGALTVAAAAATSPPGGRRARHARGGQGGRGPAPDGARAPYTPPSGGSCPSRGVVPVTPGMACATLECEATLSRRLCATSTSHMPSEQSDRLHADEVLFRGTRKTGRRLYGVDGSLFLFDFVRSLHDRFGRGRTLR